MAINSTSPTTFESGVLIADTTNVPGGARGVINEIITPSTALDIQSTSGAFVPPRMTTVQRLALDPSNGMIVYDTTLDAFRLYEGGQWTPLGAGDVVGPPSSLDNNIAIFSGTSGKILDDSGVSISAVPLELPFLSEEPLVELQLGGVDIISYNDVGLIFTGGDYVVGFHKNSLVGRPPNTVFGFANPSSPDANVELTEGALLLSRLTQTQINALIPADGMIVYNSDEDIFNFYQDGAWVNPIVGADPTAKYILQTANVNLPNAQSLGTLTTGLLKNTVTLTTGVLSTATPGVDYYAPGFPTTLLYDANQNLFLGNDAGNTTLTGFANIGIGRLACDGITTGSYNVCVGEQSGVNITSGSRNICIGETTAGSLGSSSDNLHIGYRAGLSQSGGGSNIFIGTDAGLSRATYTDCIFIGKNVDALLSGFSNSVAIGNNAIVATSNVFVIGNSTQSIVINNSSGSYDLNLYANSVNNTAFFHIANSPVSTPVPPVTGGGVIYAQGGTLYYVSENGTTTQLAPA
jgi:hypothetical protein